MSKIKATKTTEVSTVQQFLELARTHGFENVTVHYFDEFINHSIENGLQISDYREIIENGNNDTVKHLVHSIFNDDNYIAEFAKTANISTIQFMTLLSEEVAKRKVLINTFPRDLPLAALNAMVESGAVDLYYVERISSIDVDFVKKHHEYMDLRSLQYHSPNADVRELAVEIIEKETN